MMHLPIFPILLPSFAAILLLFLVRAPLALRRGINLAATAALIALAVWLLSVAAAGDHLVYELGAWPAPFGIVLVADRLSTFMILLTALIAFFSLLFAVQGWDSRGKNFHPLFQFQLMGLNIAFLTGDIFNLFVAFEVLLIASYGLLLHGGGRRRVRAGLHYVIVNLTGSALFLLAVGLIYGVTGTLNMADLAARAGEVPADNLVLFQAGALLLFVVFGIKGALVPLYFWLPGAYSAASAPVAALFAIMTKVGAYAIIRLYVGIFGGTAVSALVEDYLLPVALVTLTLGMIGVLSARNLRRLVAYMVVASMGTLLTAVGLYTEESLSAGLYYTAHGTIVVAALFLLSGLITGQRGRERDRLAPAHAVAQPAVLGALFFALAVAAVGLPPLSGFFGKLLILSSAQGDAAMAWVWSVILVTSLFALIAFSRAGSVLFWKTEGAAPATVQPAQPALLLPVTGLLGLLLLLVVLADPVTRYMNATAVQLLDREGYMEAVLGTPRAIEAGPLPLLGEEVE